MALALTAGRLGTEAVKWAMTRLGRVRERRVVLDGVNVPYLSRAGAGETVLMVHGFAADKESWFLMAPLLSRRRGLLTPDLPGYGAADPVPADRVSLSAQADTLRRLLDHAGVDRAHVVGNSMGGGIALRLAADAPDRVQSLALLGSMGPRVTRSSFDEALARGRNPLIPRSLDDGAELLAYVAERRLPLPRPMWLWATQQRVEIKERLAVMFEVVDGGGTWSGLPDDLGSIDVPALVVHGDCDRVIHPDVARALTAVLPRAELEMLRGVGHMPQIEAGWHTAKLLDAFFDRQDRG